MGCYYRSYLKLIQTIAISKNLIGYLNKVIIPLVLLILPKVSGYDKTFKAKDKKKKLMSFRINDGKVFQKYKTIWTN